MGGVALMSAAWIASKNAVRTAPIRRQQDCRAESRDMTRRRLARRCGAKKQPRILAGVRSREIADSIARSENKRWTAMRRVRSRILRHRPPTGRTIKDDL
jgi:hypothetical protein